MSSLSQATQKQYLSSLKPWLKFCQDNNIDSFNPEIKQVLSFLNASFKDGASYGTLNTQRSALSLISKNKVGEDPLVSRFLKGCFKIKPTKPKYSYTWDVNVVLDYFEKLDDLSKLPIEVLTEKTITLLALVSAHRAQTLSKISIDNITTTSLGFRNFNNGGN